MSVSFNSAHSHVWTTLNSSVGAILSRQIAKTLDNFKRKPEDFSVFIILWEKQISFFIFYF